MAEIKSTLDLVMERTRDMTLSPEERREILARDREKKARGILLRLTEGSLDPDNLRQAAVEASSAEEAPALVGDMRRLLVHDLSLDQDLGPAAAGIEVLAGRAAVEPLQALQAIQREYRQALDELESQGAAEALKDLAARGITGSALRPKPTRTADFEKRAAALHGRFADRFEQTRRALQQAASPARG